MRLDRFEHFDTDRDDAVVFTTAVEHRKTGNLFGVRYRISIVKGPNI